MNNSECWPKFRLQIPTQDSCSSAVCVRLRERITWRFELWWKTSWLPWSCGAGMGWRKADLWFLHSSGTHKDCIFSSNGNNKTSWLPKPCSALNCPLDGQLFLSIWSGHTTANSHYLGGREGTVHGSEWLAFQLFFISVFLQKHIRGQRGRGRLCQYVDYQWSKGLIVSNALLKTESKISGNLWGFLQEAFMQANCTC